MFSLCSIVKYFTLMCYVGLFITSISGFYETSKSVNICTILNSIILFINVPIILYFEIINKNKEIIQIVHYGRAYVILIMALISIGISHIGIGFGVYAIIISLANLFLGVFDCDDEIHKVEPIREETNTEETV